MCYFYFHYFSCFSRGFLPTVNYHTHEWRIEVSSCWELVLLQFTLSGVMKYVRHYFIDLCCSLLLSWSWVLFTSLFHAVLSVFSPTDLSFLMWSHWFVIDCFLTVVNCSERSARRLVNPAVFPLLLQIQHTSKVSLFSLLPPIADAETNSIVYDKCSQDTCCCSSSHLVMRNSFERGWRMVVKEIVRHCGK